MLGLGRSQKSDVRVIMALGVCGKTVMLMKCSHAGVGFQETLAGDMLRVWRDQVLGQLMLVS